ncbi:MAG: sigma 54-interacting transcriptional regulator, partial [Desulforhopalus sp.]
GAIFLDEIGEVSLPVQIKLLHILQERLFTPVGSHRPQRFEGRVIAATNQDIQGLRKKGLFRDDFYYRLCSDSIEVPPLRQRIKEDPGELRRLLERTVERILGCGSDELVTLVAENIDQFLPGDYPWPGNVRELEQCTRRVLLKRGYEGDFGGGRETDEADRLATALRQGSLTARELLGTYCKQLHKKLDSYDAVAKRLDLDWRTVKKYVEA